MKIIEWGFIDIPEDQHIKAMEYLRYAHPEQILTVNETLVWNIIESRNEKYMTIFESFMQ